MSRFSGPQYKGAMRVYRETKRAEAASRQARPIYRIKTAFVAINESLTELDARLRAFGEAARLGLVEEA